MLPRPTALQYRRLLDVRQCKICKCTAALLLHKLHRTVLSQGTQDGGDAPSFADGGMAALGRLATCECPQCSAAFPTQIRDAPVHSGHRAHHSGSTAAGNNTRTILQLSVR